MRIHNRRIDAEVKQATWIWIEFRHDSPHLIQRGCLHTADVQKHLGSVFQTLVDPMDTEVDVKVDKNRYTINYTADMSEWWEDIETISQWKRAYTSFSNLVDGSYEEFYRKIRCISTAWWTYETLLEEGLKFSHVIILKPNKL